MLKRLSFFLASWLLVFPFLLKAQDTKEEYEVKTESVTEDFEYPLRLPFKLGKDHKGNVYLENGKLILEARTDSGIARYVTFDTPKEPEEVFMEAKIKFIKGKHMGLLFNFEDWDNYGWVLFSVDKRLSVGFVKDKELYYYVRDIPLFKFSPYKWNLVKIAQTLKGIKIFVNGYVELTERRPPVHGKQYGFVVLKRGSMAVDELTLGYEVVLRKEGSVYARVFGSGIVLDRFHVLTAYHTVENASKVFITLMKEEKEDTSIEATVLYHDKKLDIAVLKTEQAIPLSFPVPYAIKRTGILPLGAYVFALGYPLIHAGMGTSLKFHDGRISSKVGFEGDVSQYQTTIPASPGYSGAPVFDEKGNLIGILTAKHTLAENASYVVKASAFTSLLDLIENTSFPQQSSIQNFNIDKQITALSPYVVIIKVQ